MGLRYLAILTLLIASSIERLWHRVPCTVRDSRLEFVLRSRPCRLIEDFLQSAELSAGRWFVVQCEDVGMQSAATNIADYFAEVPASRRDALTTLRDLCVESLVGYEESM